jgi:alkylhydroperoxidase/carboxymuconolactone decarboxylase family protein YurZ
VQDTLGLAHSSTFWHTIHILEREENLLMTDTRTARGKTVVREMLGEEFLKAMEGHVDSGGFGAQAGALAFGNAFADAWDRPGLERKYRSMITMAALIALRTPHEYQHHVRAALGNGCSRMMRFSPPNLLIDNSLFFDSH